MLHTLVRGERAELFFCADLVPGARGCISPSRWAYDRYPERLIDEKGELTEPLERGTYLFFTHDATLAATRLTRDDKGRFGAGARARLRAMGSRRKFTARWALQQISALGKASKQQYVAPNEVQ